MQIGMVEEDRAQLTRFVLRAQRCCQDRRERKRLPATRERRRNAGLRAPRAGLGSSQRIRGLLQLRANRLQPCVTVHAAAAREAWSTYNQLPTLTNWSTMLRS